MTGRLTVHVRVPIPGFDNRRERQVHLAVQLGYHIADNILQYAFQRLVLVVECRGGHGGSCAHVSNRMSAMAWRSLTLSTRATRGHVDDTELRWRRVSVLREK